MNFLIVVDMQNDFISGSLGSAHAAAIVPNVVKKVSSFDGTVIYTRIPTVQTIYIPRKAQSFRSYTASRIRPAGRSAMN